ncbi:lipopolysaccharide biosynthesis protein [Psychrobacter sanguinis]|uniref:lipopolysaccharide biosynthesis protein n=1 Tax=Psychrobacter sanguinis TaxID=861445 RepID=UPI0019199B5C|nr:oligosaccharide flippase family protein [Psychrobacter sanguinis]MCC3308765.1 oligosaccharide flippase family protein [Psychrobacter sanguinis]UEC26055.1 oligosaccharide flippase family protein [Psychrobacter sanguinis]
MNKNISHKIVALLKDTFNKKDSSSIFKGMLTLAIGSGTARIIGILSIPIITRIYSPSDYGVLALYVSTVSILVPGATLRYGTAIPLPKKDAFAINLLALGFLLILLYCISLFTIFYFFSDIIFLQFNISELGSLWWLVILSIAGAAIYELLNSWATRKKQYRVMATTQFAQSFIGNSSKIVLGLLGYKPIGLIIGQLLTLSSGSGGLIKASFKDFRLLLPNIKLSRIKFAAAYYKQFPIFRLPSQLLLQVSSNAPVLMMSALYGKGLTGQLSLAIMAISLPTGIISQAISSAFYAEIAKIGRRNLDQVRYLTIDIQKKLFLIGIPITILVMLLSESMFKVVFGAEWQVAGQFAAILAPFVLLQFTSNPLMQVLNIAGSQKHFLLINITRILGLAVLLLIFNTYEFSHETFVIALSIYLSLYYLGTTLFIIFTVRKPNITINPT